MVQREALLILDLVVSERERKNLGFTQTQALGVKE